MATAGSEPKVKSHSADAEAKKAAKEVEQSELLASNVAENIDDAAISADKSFADPTTAGAETAAPDVNVKVEVKKAESDDDKAVLTRFLKLSGYDRGDVDIVHEKQRVFLTTNGGKYQLNKKGTEIRILKGPNYPELAAPTDG